ncbi:hypothetical protein SB749_20450, partial [Brevibacterium sp. SIMBA_078]
DSQDDVGQSTQKTDGIMSKYSSGIKVGLVGALAAGVAGLGALTAAVGTLGAKMANDSQVSQGKLRAQLGLTEEQAKKLTG